MLENSFNGMRHIREKLKSRGYKLTRQRLYMIRVLYKNNTHMNADEIYNKVKSKNIGLSTVYRNLAILEEVGVLKKINATNIVYYELDRSDKDKICIHAKCIKCNKIVDIKEDVTSENYNYLIEKLANSENEILIESVSVVISGICKECKRKQRL